MTSAFGIEVFHLVTGLNIEMTSMCWCDSLCRRFIETCPVMATNGARSR